MRLRRYREKFKSLTESSSEGYWSGHNVTNHRDFRGVDESLAYLDWRNDQYIDYIELLPVKGHDGETILDFGCGPGNDLVGFISFSKPKRVVGADVSQPSLKQARSRVALHAASGVEFTKIDETAPSLPFEDGEFDYIHCSGVLMYSTNPTQTLKEFNRILKPGGYARLMVYNYESIWVHLYVAHVLRTTDPEFTGLPVMDVFKKSTDGKDCPINNCWSPAQFQTLAGDAGFDCHHLGNAISLWEMSLLDQRFAATQNLDLEAEHRKFLLALTFDDRAIPHYQGRVAGIDGCFEFRKAGANGTG